MLKKIQSGRGKYGLSRYLAREANGQINRWLFKTSRATLLEAFRSIGIEAGMTVCVHASLSRLGHIEGGADTVIDALIEAVGPEGCIMMPAFSADGTMLRSVEQGDVFDVRNTPSRVGAIPEVFRLRDGVLRSLHPTNSVTALGVGAEELLRDHEKSATPFGFSTPYGRLAAREDAYVLMLNTHVHSLLHHIQERVDFPNLFLADERDVVFVDYRGTRNVMRTQVMRPRIPYYVAVPAVDRPEPDWAILHDFALMFPRGRDKRVRELGYRFDGCKALYERRERLIAEGILKSRRLARGEIGLLNAARFVRAIQPEFESSIERFGSYYTIDYLSKQRLPYD